MRASMRAKYRAARRPCAVGGPTCDGSDCVLSDADATRPPAPGRGVSRRCRTTRTLARANRRLVGGTARHHRPLLPRLVTLLSERDPAFKNSTVHVGATEWPRPTNADESAPWWKAVRHHPGKRHFDGPEHDWTDARNRRDKEHYLGTRDAPDEAICRGHFYLHKIKDVSGKFAASRPRRGGEGRRS